MRNLKFLLGSILSLIVCGSAVAQDGVSVSGFADMSCGAWAKSSGAPFEQAQYLIWFRGFISGYNYGQPTGQLAPDQLPSNDTIALYVDRFCRENPLSGFPGAAFKLVEEIRQ